MVHLNLQRIKNEEMIKHIGLTISNIQEIYDFYGQIMGFEKVKQFPLYREVAQNIFGYDESPEVFLLKKGSVELEIFVSLQKYKPAWSHICLEIPDAREIFTKARKHNYRTIFKENDKGGTFFISDSSNNLFELKPDKQ